MACGLVPVLLAGLAAGTGDKPRIPDMEGKDGTVTFDVSARADGAPCVSYAGPGGSGGNCFVAAGAFGGWAVEAT